jgi:D-arabinose 1-dehydrogenase-like Zn-dependent alcohol dehydrogenase
VRIKVNQVGICGTDLLIHHGEFNAVFPLTPGHEVVGTVDQLSDGVEEFRRAGHREPASVGWRTYAAWTKRPPTMPLDAGEVGSGTAVAS